MIANINNIRTYLQRCIHCKEIYPVDFECQTYNDVLRKGVIDWFQHMSYDEHNVYMSWYICREFTLNLSVILHAKQLQYRSMSVDDLLNCKNIIKKKVKETIKRDYYDMFIDHPSEFFKCFNKKYILFEPMDIIKKHIITITKQTISILKKLPYDDYNHLPVTDLYECHYHLIPNNE